MTPKILSRIFLCLPAAPLAFYAQTGESFELTAESLQNGQQITLDKAAWKYRAGDDANWAARDYEDADWETTEGATITNDYVMVMSDGFPEMFNEEGEMHDFAQAKIELEKTAQNSPQEIIDHFVKTGKAWAGTRSPDDDATFVVLKFKNDGGIIS